MRYVLNTLRTCAVAWRGGSLLIHRVLQTWVFCLHVVWSLLLYLKWHPPLIHFCACKIMIFSSACHCVSIAFFCFQLYQFLTKKTQQKQYNFYLPVNSSLPQNSSLNWHLQNGGMILICPLSFLAWVSYFLTYFSSISCSQSSSLNLETSDYLHKMTSASSGKHCGISVITQPQVVPSCHEQPLESWQWMRFIKASGLICWM